MFSIRIINTSNLLASIVCFVTLFWYIYTPNIRFIPFSIDKILLVLFLGWAITNRSSALVKALSNRTVVIFILLYVLTFIYTLALDSLVFDSFYVSYHVLQYAGQYIPFSLCLYLYMFFNFGEKALEQLFKLLLILIFMQSLFGLLMLFNAELKNIIYGIQVQDGQMYKGLLLRGNGFASGLLFSVPIIHCILISALLISPYSMSVLFKFLMLVIVVAVALTNARTSFVPLLLTIPFILMNAFKFKALGHSISALLVPSVIILIFWIIFPLNIISTGQGDILTQIIDWIVGGYSNLLGIESMRANEQIIENLTRETYVNFDAIPFFFGEGVNAFNSSNNQSDIGLINLLRFGGIFYLIFAHLVTYLCIYFAYRRADSTLYKRLLILIGGTYFLVSFKGIVFTEQILSRFMILICIFVILHSLRNRFATRAHRRLID